MNRWQWGVMQLLGKIHPRVWQTLWVLAKYANEKGECPIGIRVVRDELHLSQFHAERWLRLCREQEWFVEISQVVPVEVHLDRTQAPLTRRKVTTKILDPRIAKGLPVPGYEHPASGMKDIRRCIARVARRKHYLHWIRFNESMQKWEKKRERGKKRERKK